MAISKEQPLRPYVQELGDAFDQTLTNTVYPLVGRFRFGITDEITIPANSSYSGSVTYAIPFDETTNSIPFVGFAAGDVLTNLSIVITDSSYSGFSYSVANANEEDATVRLGYMGVRVG